MFIWQQQMFPHSISEMVKVFRIPRSDMRNFIADLNIKQKYNLFERLKLQSMCTSHMEEF